MELREHELRRVVRARQVLAQMAEDMKSGELYRDPSLMAVTAGRLEYALEDLLLIIDPDGSAS